MLCCLPQGGPGKGMYTRLYQNILNRYPSVEAASVFNAFYSGVTFCEFKFLFWMPLSCHALA